MSKTAEAGAAERATVAPLVLRRLVHAPRATVFRAWTSAELVRRWFSPATYTTPEASIDARPGGAFDVCMQSPSGERHWIRGIFAEVDPERRLVIDMRSTDAEGRLLFTSRTEVDFADALGGTQLEIIQTYALTEPEIAAPMVAGAREGWRTTLDKLEQVALAAHGAVETTARSVVHATFTVQRTYAASPQRVWRALTEPAAKAAWFGPPPGAFETLERTMDVRPGGRERFVGRWEGGVVSEFDAVYHDVVAPERLVYSYTMHTNGKQISVSLTTMEVSAAEGGTRLAVTEQGAFLDGYDDAGQREHGTGLLLDALGASLREA